MTPSDYQPVVPTALRSLYSFARSEEGALVVRHTYPQAQFRESARGLEQMHVVAHVIAEQMAFVRLASAQRDLPPGEALPECMDAPHEVNARRDYTEPVTLDDEAINRNIADANATLADLQRQWPQVFRAVQNWLTAGSAATPSATPAQSVHALRSALEPIAGSQSEQAFVPPGAVGFARCLRGRPVFAGSAPAAARSVARSPRNFEEVLYLAITGELPGEPKQTAIGTGDFEFPEPIASNPPKP